jgi:hypothetical protein
MWLTMTDWLVSVFESARLGETHDSGIRIKTNHRVLSFFFILKVELLMENVTLIMIRNHFMAKLKRVLCTKRKLQ